MTKDRKEDTNAETKSQLLGSLRSDTSYPRVITTRRKGSQSQGAGTIVSHHPDKRDPQLDFNAWLSLFCTCFLHWQVYVSLELRAFVPGVIHLLIRVPGPASIMALPSFVIECMRCFLGLILLKPTFPVVHTILVHSLDFLGIANVFAC